MRVILADDHAMIVAAMCALLQQMGGISVVGQAHDGRTAVQLAQQMRPDIVLMDVSMQELNGIEAAAQIRVVSPSTRVIMLSSLVDPDVVERSLNAGASGYVVKGALPEELEAALRAVSSGDLYLSPRAASELVPRLLRGAGTNASPLDQLSARQREVLQLIAEGRRTKEIAATLKVSVKTVDTHRMAIMERLGIRDVAGLVLFAVRHGLVSPGD